MIHNSEQIESGTILLKTLTTELVSRKNKRSESLTFCAQLLNSLFSAEPEKIKEFTFLTEHESSLMRCSKNAKVIFKRIIAQLKK